MPCAEPAAAVVVVEFVIVLVAVIRLPDDAAGAFTSADQCGWRSAAAHETRGADGNEVSTAAVVAAARVVPREALASAGGRRGAAVPPAADTTTLGVRAGEVMVERLVHCDAEPAMLLRWLCAALLSLACCSGERGSLFKTLLCGAGRLPV